MEILLEDITKENWEYIAFLTTNEDRIPTLIEKNLNGNAYSMLEVLYRETLVMKAIVLCNGQEKKELGLYRMVPQKMMRGIRFICYADS